MKKVKFAIFLLISVFVIAACGANDNDTEEQAGEAPKEEKGKQEVTELEWLAHPVYSLQSPNEDTVTYVQSKIDEFEEANENYKISGEVLSSNIPEAMARLLEQASQGRAPHIAQIDGYILPRFYDYLQPLDPLFEQAGLDIEDFFPFAQEVMTGPDGQIYGMQFTTDTRVLYYNTELVEKAPETWDEVFAMSESLSADGYESLMLPAGRGEGTTVTSVLPLFWAQGGELVDEDGNANFGEGENREYMLNVLNFLHEGVQNGAIPQRVANYGSESDLNAEVATGKVAMFMGGSWQVNQLADVLSEDELAKWAIAPLPQQNADQKATSAGGWAWAIFAEDEAEQEAAFDFLLRTFVGDEGMAEWTTVGGYLPTRSSIYDHEKFEANEYTEVFKEHLEGFAQTRPSATVYPDISSQLQIAASNVVSGSKTPEEALEEAWQAVSK
jgi:multiple sugar transport system substrate-binding protein